MAFANSWVETDPDGAVITGSLLDDHQRLTKRAVRERLEGDPANPNSGIFESGTFAATAIVRAGTARAYVVTAANLGTLTLQDGRMAITSDTNRLYHLKGSGLVELAYMPLTGGAAIGQLTITTTGTNPLNLGRGEVGLGQMAHLIFYRNAVVKGSVGLTASDALALNDSGGIASVTITTAGMVTIFGTPSMTIKSRTGADVYIVLEGIAASGHLNWSIGKSFTVANAFQLTPSTAADGNVYTTPVFTLTSGGALTVTSVTGTIITAAQGNITSVGVLTTLSVAGNASFGGATDPVKISNSTSYGLVTFNGSTVLTTMLGIFGRSNPGEALWFNVPTGYSYNFAVNGVTAVSISTGGDLTIPATKKFYIDGGVDTYVTESSGNEIDIYVGASQALNISNVTPRVFVVARPLIISAAQKFYLDGGVDTYIYEVAANAINIVAGAVVTATITGTTWNLQSVDLVIPALKRFYLDGGGDTYIFESAANTFQGVVGGVNAFAVTATNFGIFSGLNFTIATTKQFFLDGGNDTWIYESGANQFDIVTGGTNYFRVIPAQIQIRQAASLVIDAAQKFFLDGGSGGNTYIWEQSADSMQLVAGGTVGFIMTATTLNLSNLASITGATVYNGNTAGTHTGGVTGNLTGTVLTASQTNITAVGTLGAVTVTGLADVGSLKVGGGATVTKFLTATYTYNPPNIVAGGFDSFSVTVTGAAVGDTAIIDNVWEDNGLLLTTAKVTSADTVSIGIRNHSAGAIDALSMSGRVWVIKP